MSQWLTFLAIIAAWTVTTIWLGGLAGLLVAAFLMMVWVCTDPSWETW